MSCTREDTANTQPSLLEGSEDVGKDLFARLHKDLFDSTNSTTLLNRESLLPGTFLIQRVSEI